MRIIVRMQRGKSPGTGISVKFRSGMLVQPSRRAADAGKPARRSGVTVNNAEATSSSSNLFRSRIAMSSFSVALNIASRSSLSACVAPRIPRTLISAAITARVQEKHIERLAFAWRQLAEMRRPQRAQGHRTEAHPFQRDQRMIDHLEHASHLAIASFVQRQIDDGTIPRNGDYP